jgi:hypothetical protein
MRGNSNLAVRGRSPAIHAVVLALALVPLMPGCGAQDDRPAERDASVLEWKGTPLGEHFTEVQIADVYETAIGSVGGKRIPVSKSPVGAIYTRQDAPPEFRDAFGDFSAGTETRGYLNLGLDPSRPVTSHLLTKFELVSRWKTMRNAEGEVIFDDAFTMDAKGRKTADVSDGAAPVEGELRFAQLSLPTGTILGSLATPVRMMLHERDGEIQLDVANLKDVDVFLIGTIIKAGALKIHMKVYPYKAGWLIYGASAVHGPFKVADALV